MNSSGQLVLFRKGHGQQDQLTESNCHSQSEAHFRRTEVNLPCSAHFNNFWSLHTPTKDASQTERPKNTLEKTSKRIASPGRSSIRQNSNDNTCSRPAHREAAPGMKNPRVCCAHPRVLSARCPRLRSPQIAGGPCTGAAH